MKDFDWTAEAVAELVKDWPDEARPKDSIFILHDGWRRRDWYSIVPFHAAALHVASGLEWLAKFCTKVAILPPGSPEPDMDTWLIKCGWHGDTEKEGPTLLHAISAAIREVAK